MAIQSNLATCAKLFTTEVQFGHATSGSLANLDMETADDKNRAMREASFTVPHMFEGLMNDELVGESHQTRPERDCYLHVLRLPELCYVAVSRIYYVSRFTITGARSYPYTRHIQFRMNVVKNLRDLERIQGHRSRWWCRQSSLVQAPSSAMGNRVD